MLQTPPHEELFIELDLTANTLLSLGFLAQFPYEEGDTCVLVDVRTSFALVRLNRDMATTEQLTLLQQTPAIAAYAFKERAEVSAVMLEQAGLLAEGLSLPTAS